MCVCVFGFKSHSDKNLVTTNSFILIEVSICNVSISILYVFRCYWLADWLACLLLLLLWRLIVILFYPFCKLILFSRWLAWEEKKINAFSAHFTYAHALKARSLHFIYTVYTNTLTEQSVEPQRSESTYVKITKF